MNDQSIKYMVEFSFDEEFPAHFSNILEKQIKVAHKYFLKGKLLSYTVSIDRLKLWAIFTCFSEPELVQLIEKMPISSYGDYVYQEILYHEMIAKFPSFSYN